MKHTFWFCNLLLSLYCGLAQQKPRSAQYDFSLAEAIAYAQKNSYAAIHARKDVAKALQKKWETTTDGLPQLDAKIDYQNQLKQPVSAIPAEFSGGTPGTFVPAVFGVKQQVTLGATLRQLIFDGSYLVGLKAAKSFLQFTSDTEAKVKQEVTQSVTKSYSGLLVAQERVRILENNYNALSENLNEVKKILENGLIEEEDVEQLQITALQIKNQLGNAKRMQLIAHQMFNLNLGIAVDTQTRLTDTLDDLTQQHIDPLVVSQNFTIEKNIDYKLAYLFTEQRSLELQLEKRRLLPSIGVFLDYGLSTFGNDFVFLRSSTPWYNYLIFGGNITVPVFSSGKGGSRIKQAKLSLEQANTDFVEAQQQIQLQYNTAISSYKFALENFETSKQNLTLAERIENKNQVKNKEGLATSFDLRQAQLQLYSTQQEVLQAKLEIIETKIALQTILNISQK